MLPLVTGLLPCSKLQLGRFLLMTFQALQQPLPCKILVCPTIEHIALAVLILLLNRAVPGVPVQACLQLCVESLGVLNGCDVVEVLGVGDSQASHSVRMTPLLEVAVEGPAAHVGGAAADLALELHAQSVQLVQPVGDGLAVPAQRQVQRVVHGALVVRVLLLPAPAAAALLLERAPEEVLLLPALRAEQPPEEAAVLPRLEGLAEGQQQPRGPGAARQPLDAVVERQQRVRAVDHVVLRHEPLREPVQAQDVQDERGVVGVHAHAVPAHQRQRRAQHLPHLRARAVAAARPREQQLHVPHEPPGGHLAAAGLRRAEAQQAAPGARAVALGQVRDEPHKVPLLLGRQLGHHARVQNAEAHSAFALH
mmetsp:Transcript_12242/g.19680  ORF Transcript_12242/g.19680 Transcript_12242/m.19680 type:complete len:366 (-) Transcript_12242:130-1227(-)